MHLSTLQPDKWSDAPSDICQAFENCHSTSNIHYRLWECAPSGDHVRGRRVFRLRQQSDWRATYMYSVWNVDIRYWQQWPPLAVTSERSAGHFWAFWVNIAAWRCLYWLTFPTTLAASGCHHVYAALVHNIQPCGLASCRPRLRNTCTCQLNP